MLADAAGFPPRPRRSSERAGRKLADILDLALPAAVLAVITAACFLLPWIIALPDPVGGNIRDANLGPLSPGHLLGTDLNGNDVLSRLLHGGRTSLRIAVAANLFGLLIGGALGAAAAYLGEMVDAIVMRVLDVIIAFPSLILVLAIAQSLEPNEFNSIVALTFFSIPAFGRIARAATLQVRVQPYMVAAELCGTGRLRSLFHHVAPNILPQLMVFALLGLGIAVVLEGALSYLGLGVPLPQPTWGSMIAQSQHELLTRPSALLLPAGLLFLTALSCNLLGEALRTRWVAS